MAKRTKKMQKRRQEKNRHCILMCGGSQLRYYLLFLIKRDYFASFYSPSFYIRLLVGG